MSLDGLPHASLAAVARVLSETGRAPVESLRTLSLRLADIVLSNVDVITAPRRIAAHSRGQRPSRRVLEAIRGMEFRGGVHRSLPRKPQLSVAPTKASGGLRKYINPKVRPCYRVQLSCYIHMPVLHSGDSLVQSALQGPGCNDRNLSEKLVNVVTSLPFAFAGLQIVR